MKNIRKSKGFTLIEILVVIGIIAILAAIVIIAINPAKQFAQARNTQRQAGVNTILNAIGQRLADNKGIFAGEFTVGTGATAKTYYCNPLPSDAVGAATENINSTARTSVTTAESGDLGCLVPTYVATIPLDPTILPADAPYTGYDVGVDTTGRITVCANRAHLETSIPGADDICVTR
jgi:prepilin-type N-terminal cleavage/methylation domain-containing protein